VISTAPSATSSARPYAVAIACTDRRDRLCSPSPELPPYRRCSGEDRPSGPPLLGLCSLQRSSSGAAPVRRCHLPDDAASTFRTAEAAGPHSLSRAESSRAFRSLRPFVLAVFRLALRKRDGIDGAFGVTCAIGSIICRSKRRPPSPRDIRQRCSVSAWRSGLAQSGLRRLAGVGGSVSWPAARHRSWDFALRSFIPAEQFHSRSPRRRPTCPWNRTPSAPISFRRGTGRQSKLSRDLDSARPMRMCPFLDFWALTCPCQPFAAGRFGTNSAALGFASFGSTGHEIGAALVGSTPPALVAVACSASGGSPLLSFGLSRWPACRNPVGPRQFRSATRRLLFSDSKAADAWLFRSRRLRSKTRRTSNPYEVFHLLTKRPMHSLA